MRQHEKEQKDKRMADVIFALPEQDTVNATEHLIQAQERFVQV